MWHFVLAVQADMLAEEAEEGGSYKKSSCRRKNVRGKATPAKENMEPPAPPPAKDSMEPPAAVAMQPSPQQSKTRKPKALSRRKLCNTSLHPALASDEVSNMLQEIVRKSLYSRSVHGSKCKSFKSFKNLICVFVNTLYSSLKTSIF